MIGGSEWDVGGDPIRDVQSAIEKSFQPVSAVWFNQKVGHAFLRNPAVRDHMRQMLGDGAAPQATMNVARLIRDEQGKSMTVGYYVARIS